MRAKDGINRRLTARMSKLNPWKVRFDIPMPQEVFDLLHKGIIKRTSFGVEIVERPGSVTITFTSLRKLCVLFNQFEDCSDFQKQFKDRGEACTIYIQAKGRTFKI